MKVLVIPSIRKEQVQQLIWHENMIDWDSIIVVEDNPKPTMRIMYDDRVSHYSWADVDARLGDKSWIISKRDSAIRSFGFLKAHEFGAKYIFTLDDDCIPEKTFIEDHINNLERTPRWTTSANGRTRGLPYENLGVLPNVVMSLGLWTGVPDFDAIQTLSNPDTTLELPKQTRIMPHGQFFPFCGMNFCFKRSVTPLCYFPLMGEGVPYNRFDDIWFGIIAKKICDHLNLLITCGKPFIHHQRASDKYKNLEREAAGIRVNEQFWEYIDGISLTSKTPAECMAEVGEHLQITPLKVFDERSDYRIKLGRALLLWASLFK